LVCANCPLALANVCACVLPSLFALRVCASSLPRGFVVNCQVDAAYLRPWLAWPPCAWLVDPLCNGASLCGPKALPPASYRWCVFLRTRDASYPCVARRCALCAPQLLGGSVLACCGQLCHRACLGLLVGRSHMVIDLFGRCFRLLVVFGEVVRLVPWSFVHLCLFVSSKALSTASYRCCVLLWIRDAS
jgi:hypothetical protein